MKKNIKRILIVGSNGYIGSHFFNYYKTNPDIFEFGIDKEASCEKNFFQCDLLNKKYLEEILKNLKPDVIINSAGISNLTACDENKDLANKINVETNKNLVDLLSLYLPKAKYIFLSSDYVFKGDKGNYRETDVPDPLTYYGKTKYEAEKYTQSNLFNYAICRAANVYGHGGNFFNFVLNNLRQNKEIEVYNNTFFNPTYIGNIIEMINFIIDEDLKGIFHTVGSSIESRYTFALKIADVFNKNKNLIKAVKKPENVLISNNSTLSFENTKLRIKWLKFLNVEEGLNEVSKNNKIEYKFNFIDERGSINNIFKDNIWKEINYIYSQKNCIRGNHYHKKTLEGFFIFEGKIHIKITDTLSGEERYFFAVKGDYFIIKPYELHIFETLSDSTWINFLSESMKNRSKDLYRMENSK